MVLTSLILGAALLVGTTLLTKYWNKAVVFMKKVLNKLISKIPDRVLGSAIFLRDLGRLYQNRTKHYSKSELGKWTETIVTYDQNENEVPEEYRRYAYNRDEYDLTKELELQLKG